MTLSHRIALDPTAKQRRCFAQAAGCAAVKSLRQADLLGDDDSRLDVVVLVSGDNDLLPLVECLAQSGVRVELVGFVGSTATQLSRSCHFFTPIAMEWTFKEKNSSRRLAVMSHRILVRFRLMISLMGNLLPQMRHKNTIDLLTHRTYITRDGLPCYVPQSGRGFVLIPLDHFLKHFPDATPPARRAKDGGW